MMVFDGGMGCSVEHSASQGTESHLLNNDLQSAGKAGEADRRDTLTPGNRFLGRVVACNGARATIAAIAEDGNTDLTELWSVGRLISISVPPNRVVALAYSMETGADHWVERHDNQFRIEVELLGEVQIFPDGREQFSTGISRYPYLGAIAHRIRSSDLMRIYDTGKTETCVVGKLTQDESIDATIHIPSMLSKHFAVVGSTGVGKSTAVSLLLHRAIRSDPRLRVLILDPHNEFAAAFPDHAVVIDTESLDLPFWLMRLDEFAEVIFRGRPPIAEELDMLRDIIPEAKKAFRGSESSLMRRQSDKNSYTADTPVPYRMADLLALIDDRIGKLEGRSEKPALRSLKVRVLSAINDPRYHFMFSSNTITDTILETVAHIFRIPGDNRPICTFQLAGIPSEVVNSVASVLCRLAFELAMWSNGAIHMLVVCEEAHRYVPADPNLGFFPTRQAIARIAKEGRKYGASLGIITQRPGELDQTILSQCSTLFAMRLSNDRDQDIIRSAIPNSSISTTNFISSIGNGEAIAFGEAIAVPMRMRFTRVEHDRLPKANTATSKVADDTPETVDLRMVVNRMRAAGVQDTSGQFSLSGAEREAFDMATEDSFEGFARAPSYPAPGQDPAPEPHQPYNPSMLPRGLASPAPRLDPSQQRSSLARDLPPREPLAREPLTREPLAREPLRSSYASEPAPQRHGAPPTTEPPKREPGTSLRDSILKKPLSSLYRKD